MFSWPQIIQNLRLIVDTVIRFINARRREEATFAFAAILLLVGYSFSKHPLAWLTPGLNDFLNSWHGQSIFQTLFYVAGSGMLVYGGYRIWRLVYVPDLPPEKNRPSAIKGPMAFTEDDGALFRKLGRERDLQRLLGLVLDNQVPLVIVRGASGAGKTSLLRAGLAHILADKGVSYHYWEATPTKPDKGLLHMIRATWPDGAAKPSTLDELVNPSDKLCVQGRVIVLDQFEQLRGSEPIFRLLRKITRDAKPPHRITWVIAFRREFSADWMDFVSPEQERGFRPPHDLSLRLFTIEQAREVIGQLVSESGLSVEQAVVDNLVEAATAEGEVSPVDIGIGLLALAELHERRGGKTVTIRDYQFAGGAEGLLTQYISRQLELFAEEDRETILKAMLALRDPETNQRIAEGLDIDELAKEAGSEARLLKPLLNRMAQRDVRLLEIVTTPGEPSARYRLPHEGLIPALYRLTGKLLAQVDQARLKFEEAFQAWKNDDKRSYFLLRGNDLRLVKRFETQIPWGSNEQEKRTFLFLSKRHHKIKYGMAWIAALSIVWILQRPVISYVRKEATIYQDKITYSAILFDLQHQLNRLKKLELTNSLAIESFPCLSSQPLEELSLRFVFSSDFFAGFTSLSKCGSLKNLTLDLDYSQISDLEPLSKLSNVNHLTLDLGHRQAGIWRPFSELGKLMSLNLEYGRVSDLEPLSKLGNLTQLSLDLGNNRVNDLEPLSKLGSLIQLSLDLGTSQVSDLESLSKLSNLTQLSLDLDSSRMIDLEPLSKLSNLTQLSLDIRGSQVSDLEPLSKLSNLTQLSLYINYSQVSDLEPFSKLSNLTQLSLYIRGSRVRDLKPLLKLINLTQLSLDLDSSQMRDLELLSKLSNLTQLSLNLDYSQTSDLESLSKLSNLTQLSLSRENSLRRELERSDLEPLSKLNNLTQLSLDLGGSNVSDLEPLSKLSNLTQLSLSLRGLRLIDLEPLSKLSNLTQLSLDLGGNRFWKQERSDLEPLSKLSNLTRLSLDLRDSNVSDLEPLSKFGNLTQLSLNINYSQVSDLEPLSKLSNLTRLSLDLKGSLVNDLMPLSKLTRLQALSIESATKVQRMSLRNIPPGLVELKF